MSGMDLDTMKSKIKVLVPRLKHTCRNLSVHGPSFLARNDVHFAYRLIYFIVYIHVWIAAVASIYKYISTYQDDTIRFTTRTDYLDWNTTFPSITVCQIVNNDKILHQTQGNDKPNEKRADLFKQVAFFRGDCPSCSILCENSTNCEIEITLLSSLYRTTCKDLFIDCTWNNKPMNCCLYFKPIPTEYGTCFSLNNNQFNEKHSSYFVASSQQRGLGSLSISLSQDTEAFLHSQDDVPFWNMEHDRRITVTGGSHATILFSIVDIVNELEVMLTVPDVRQCRFPDEVPDNFHGFQYYSYSTCIIQCRIQAQLEICGCVSHLSPNEYRGIHCDLHGLRCLSKNYESLRQLKIPGNNETGLECKCLSSCTEPEYNIIAKKTDIANDDKSRVASFILGNKPFERVTRQLAHTTLDLVVAVEYSTSPKL
ncbi:unnamed protein product [Leptidea sinapis]|uniref:Sodium channel protein Nach n=1 Tax=Leptidea sinapis TaxID=189913 RepID=A0A5E4QL96_9NEOP|nr:unnamed protein product [Leptidea sinapis]